MDKSYNLLGKQAKIHRYGASIFVEHKPEAKNSITYNPNRATSFTSEMKYRDISNTFKLLHDN